MQADFTFNITLHPRKTRLLECHLFGICFNAYMVNVDKIMINRSIERKIVLVNLISILREIQFPRFQI